MSRTHFVMLNHRIPSFVVEWFYQWLLCRSVKHWLYIWDLVKTSWEMIQVDLSGVKCLGWQVYIAHNHIILWLIIPESIITPELLAESNCRDVIFRALSEMWLIAQTEMTSRSVPGESYSQARTVRKGTKTHDTAYAISHIIWYCQMQS